MYSLIMIFLLFVSSVAGTAILTNAATVNWLKKQELKANRSTYAPAAMPKGGVYSVSAEEYYLIH